MRDDLFNKLSFKKGYEIPPTPRPQQSALLYIYKQGDVFLKGGLPKTLPSYLKMHLSKEEKEEAGIETPDDAINYLENNGFVIETVPQEQAHQLCLEQHFSEVRNYLGRVYDLMCGPTLLGIEKSDATNTLFRLAVANSKQYLEKEDNHKFLPEVGKLFYKYCDSLREEIRAAKGCIEDDFYGIQHLWGEEFNYSDRKGFEYAIKRFWANLEHYHEEDRHRLALRLISKIQDYNRDRGGYDPVQVPHLPVQVPQLLIDLSLRGVKIPKDADVDLRGMDEAQS